MERQASVNSGSSACERTVLQEKNHQVRIDEMATLDSGRDSSGSGIVSDVCPTGPSGFPLELARLWRISTLTPIMMELVVKNLIVLTIGATRERTSLRSFCRRKITISHLMRPRA